MKEDIKNMKLQLDRAKHLLIALPKEAQGDHLCAAAALGQYLRTQKKRVNIVQENVMIPSNMRFIHDELKDIQPHLPVVQTLNIEIDITDTPLSDMSYDVINNKLKISIATKEGTIAPKHIQSSTSSYRYDTIFTLGVTAIENAGAPYAKAADMWSALPIINIDTNPGNNGYGHINVIDITASSLSECIFSIIEELDEHTLNTNMATLLLTGVIIATKSFKGTRVTPQLLKIVSRLMDMGANREDITNNLYRTRTLSSLKLWGAVLSRLQQHEQQKLVWSVIPRNIFIDAKTNEHDLEDIVEEILLNAQQAEVIALIYEGSQDGKTHALIGTNSHRNTRAFTETFKGTITPQRAHLSFDDMSITQAEETLIAHLKRELEKNSA